MVFPEVDTRFGRLRGQIQKNSEGLDFFSFKGIPYSKPPIGKLKFQDPVPPEPWTGVRDALEFGPTSAQLDLITNVFEGSDDCLYLNVYTKTLDVNAHHPVMVWIHGGGFLFGSGNDVFYGPDYLMTKDIVLVTINYRLGIFGFLNLDHELASGNQGLKDQVMALRWVRDNIKNFGGDSENVTIFGESAGGGSVHFLTMSPMAKGLFHKAISQSGVAINPWAISVKDQKALIYEICEELGKKTTDPVEIIEFLKTIDALELIKVQEKLCQKEMRPACHNLLAPVVDKKSPNPFFPISREVAIKQGANVPYILGHTNREGTLILQILQRECGLINEKNFTSILHPQMLNELKKYNLTTDDLRSMYLKNEKSDNYEGVVDMFSDLFFINGIHEIIKNQVENNAAPTYMYQFTYDKGYSLTHMAPDHRLPGASHMDELLYIFNMKILELLKVPLPKKGTSVYRVMQQMVEMWTNFAKTGMPTPNISELIPVYWKPVIDGTVLRYLNIGEELRMEKTLNNEERFSFKKNSYVNLE